MEVTLSVGLEWWWYEGGATGAYLIRHSSTAAPLSTLTFSACDDVHEIHTQACVATRLAEDFLPHVCVEDSGSSRLSILYSDSVTLGVPSKREQSEVQHSARS